MQKQKQNYIAFPLFLVGITFTLQFLAGAGVTEAQGGEEHLVGVLNENTHTLPYDTDPCGLTSVECDGEKTITAIVTGYNTVSNQTDSTPCEAAGGNICGRTDAVACPRKYELGTKVEIQGKEYTCLDRLAKKYDSRFDISFDKDINAAKQWGIKQLVVTIK